jgi:hypothetical protein
MPISSARLRPTSSADGWTASSAASRPNEKPNMKRTSTFSPRSSTASACRIICAARPDEL